MELNLGYSNIFFWRKWAWKTQCAVIQAYEAYKRGEIVISNIWLDFPHIRFHGWKDLPPILREIAKYCGDHVMSVEAPKNMLKEYGMVRKNMKLHNFFLLFDEIGNHLNNRSWNTNFKEPIMRDMLTEPRKYKLTIIWVCQAYADVDIAFLRACEDWFLFSKKGSWIFFRFHYTHFWVMNGTPDFDKEMYILKQDYKLAFFWKMLNFYRELYWTGEIVGVWSKWNAPHYFKEWQVYLPSPDSSSLKTKVPDMSEANKGERESAGEPPTNFTTKTIKNVSILTEQSQEIQESAPKEKKRSRGRPRKW